VNGLSHRAGFWLMGLAVLLFMGGLLGIVAIASLVAQREREVVAEAQRTVVRHDLDNGGPA
jgi:hypothetical protein